MSENPVAEVRQIAIGGAACHRAECPCGWKGAPWENRVWASIEASYHTETKHDPSRPATPPGTRPLGPERISRIGARIGQKPLDTSHDL